MNPKCTYLLFFVMVAICSCQKDLAEHQMPYQGRWESASYTIIITSEGKGSCIHKKLSMRCSGAVNITDKSMIFTSNSLDAHVFRVKFRIDQKPKVDEKGAVFMVLDGERFEQ
jgi:hypothetical protein